MTEQETLETQAAALTPRVMTLAVDGQTVTLKRLTIGQIVRLGPFLRNIAHFYGALREPAIEWDLLIQADGLALVRAAAIASGLSEGAVSRLDVDEFLPLMRALVELNGDFLAGLVRRPPADPAAPTDSPDNPASPGPGSTVSSASSDTATAGTT